MFTKRGLSDIVTSVLIILLVLVAIGIIWAFVRPTIDQGAGQLEGITGVYGIILSVEPSSLVLDSVNEEISFVVRRGEVTGTLNGINVVLEDASGTRVTIRDPSLLEPLQSKRITTRYATSALTSDPVKLFVAPLIAIGGGEERLGTLSNEVRITSTVPLAACGNNLVDATEGCDASANPMFRATQNSCTQVQAPSGFSTYYMGTLGCFAVGTSQECQLDASSCTGYCGNAIIEPTSREMCDQTLFARSCQGLPVPTNQGKGSFYSGTHASSECTQNLCDYTYAFTGCLTSGTWCGDGIVQASAGENCDGGSGCTARCQTTLQINTPCNNGLDDDNDGWTDYAWGTLNDRSFGDPGCTGAGDSSESETSTAACGNGLDDDNDGKIDGKDFGCRNPQDTNEAIV